MKSSSPRLIWSVCIDSELSSRKVLWQLQLLDGVIFCSEIPHPKSFVYWLHWLQCYPCYRVSPWWLFWGFDQILVQVLWTGLLTLVLAYKKAFSCDFKSATAATVTRFNLDENSDLELAAMHGHLVIMASDCGIRGTRPQSMPCYETRRLCPHTYTILWRKFYDCHFTIGVMNEFDR